MGVGQRIFFLHDGRTADLLRAIAAHADPDNSWPTVGGGERFTRDLESHDLTFTALPPRRFCSEANRVIEAFNDLALQDKQDILNFLRSL